jgi:hypothetical protein
MEPVENLPVQQKQSARRVPKAEGALKPSVIMVISKLSVILNPFSLKKYIPFWNGNLFHFGISSA